MFSERKVAEMAAYLLNKDGGRYAHLKLMKLLYLADREAIDKYGYSISGDKAYSMRHGPVLSNTLDLMSNSVAPQEDGWDYWISDKENHEVSLKRPVDRNSLEELSESDIEILDSVWQKFGHMNRWEIRDYTHDVCSEWIDPNGSSRPIPEARILVALGKSKEEALEHLSDLKAEESIDKLFSSI
ncbi:MAG: Panacea domain-containing protein [Methylotenera sp.]